MSCSVHVVSTVISHLKKQTIDKNSSSTDALSQLEGFKKTMLVAGKWIKHLAETTTAEMFSKVPKKL